MALANFKHGTLSPDAINSCPLVIISPPLASYLLSESSISSLLPLFFSLCLSVCLSPLHPHTHTSCSIILSVFYYVNASLFVDDKIFRLSSDVQLRPETCSPHPLLLLLTSSLSFLSPPDSSPPCIYFLLFTFHPFLSPPLG